MVDNEFCIKYNIVKEKKLMFKKRFSILKFIGFGVLLVVVLFLLFKSSITGSIV